MSAEFESAHATVTEDSAQPQDADTQMFGGGDIAEIVAPWQVVVGRSRSKHDRRLSKRQCRVSSGTPSVAHESGHVNSVDMNVAPPAVNSVDATDGQWERIPMKIDSGAVATVMPLSVARHFRVSETQLSKKGPGFRAANGTPIRHYGQRTISGIGDHFQPLGLVAQVAEVNSTLGSVHQMLRAGQCVHFESGNCYIRDTKTGRVTSMEEKNGTFEVGIWVPRPAGQANGTLVDAKSAGQSLGSVSASFRGSVSACRSRGVSTHNRFDALEAREEETVCKMPGFTRQDEQL